MAWVLLQAQAEDQCHLCHQYWVHFRQLGQQSPPHWLPLLHLWSPPHLWSLPHLQSPLHLWPPLHLQSLPHLWFPLSLHQALVMDQEQDQEWDQEQDLSVLHCRFLHQERDQSPPSSPVGITVSEPIALTRHCLYLQFLPQVLFDHQAQQFRRHLASLLHYHRHQQQPRQDCSLHKSFQLRT